MKASLANFLFGALVLSAVPVRAADHLPSKDGTGRSAADMKHYKNLTNAIQKLGGKDTPSETVDTRFEIAVKDSDEKVWVSVEQNKLFTDFLSQAETFRDGLVACNKTENDGSAFTALLDACLSGELQSSLLDTSKKVPEIDRARLQGCFASMAKALDDRKPLDAIYWGDLEKGLRKNLTAVSDLLVGTDSLKDVSAQITKMRADDSMNELETKLDAALSSKGLTKCAVKPATALGLGAAAGAGDSVGGGGDGTGTGTGDTSDTGGSETRPDGTVGGGGLRGGEPDRSGQRQAQPAGGQQQPFAQNPFSGLGGLGNQFPFDPNALGLNNGLGGLEGLLANALNDDNEQAQVITPPASNSRGGSSAPPPASPPVFPGINIPPRPAPQGQPQGGPQDMAQVPPPMWMPPPQQQAQPTPQPYPRPERDTTPQVARKSEAQIMEEARAAAKAEMASNPMLMNPAMYAQQQAPVTGVKNANQMRFGGGQPVAAKSAGSVQRPSTRTGSASKSKSRTRTGASSSGRAKRTKTQTFSGTGATLNTVNGAGQVRDGKLDAK